MNGFRPEIEIRNPIRQKKINELLLPIMRENAIDMWLILTREVNPDPMAHDIGADHVGYRGAFLFIDTGNKLEKIAISAFSNEIKWTGIYDTVISYYKEGLAPHLREIIHTYNPNAIGVNMSRDIPYADGLTAAMKEYLEEAIGPKLSQRLVSAENIAATFRARRIPEEVELFRRSAQIADKILFETLTPEVISPGKTTELDLTKVIETKMYENQVIACWAGACPAIRSGPVEDYITWSEKVIQPGDLIHIDFGVIYMGYGSDLQRNAYILRKGESELPEEIQSLFNIAMKGRELLLKEMRPGKKAYDVHRIVMNFLKGSGVDPIVVPHTLDTHHPHGAGPYLTPDYPERYGRRVHLSLEENQCFAVELIIRKTSPEHGGTLTIGLEDDGVLRKDGIEWLAPPHTEIILI